MSNGSKVLIYLSFLLFLKEQYNKNLEAQRIATAKYQQKESFAKKIGFQAFERTLTTAAIDLI